MLLATVVYVVLLIGWRGGINSDEDDVFALRAGLCTNNSVYAWTIENSNAVYLRQNAWHPTIYRPNLWSERGADKGAVFINIRLCRVRKPMTVHCTEV